MEPFFSTTFHFRIAGDGPEMRRLRSRAGTNVTFLGSMSRKAVLDEMMRAAVVAVPLAAYKGFAWSIWSTRRARRQLWWPEWALLVEGNVRLLA